MKNNILKFIWKKSLNPQNSLKIGFPPFLIQEDTKNGLNGTFLKKNHAHLLHL